MDNPEKLATFGTQDAGRRQTKQNTKHRKLKRWATQTLPKKTGDIDFFLHSTNYVTGKRL